MHEPVGEYLLSLSPNFAMNMFRVSRKSVEKYHYEFHCANPIILLTWTVSDSSSDINVTNILCCYDHFVIIIIIIVATFNIYDFVIIIIIIIIFNIYIAQINIQEDIIKYALHVKIEYEITMLPIYNFEFKIKCEDVYYMKR